MLDEYLAATCFEILGRELGPIYGHAKRSEELLGVASSVVTFQLDFLITADRHICYLPRKGSLLCFFQDAIKFRSRARSAVDF